MAKYECPACGAVVRTSGDIPNPAEFRIISSEKVFDLVDETDVGSRETIDADAFWQEAHYGYECTNCRSWLMFWDDDWGQVHERGVRGVGSDGLLVNLELTT